jgi:hypothetical protein
VPTSIRYFEVFFAISIILEPLQGYIFVRSVFSEVSASQYILLSSPYLIFAIFGLARLFITSRKRKAFGMWACVAFFCLKFVIDIDHILIDNVLANIISVIQILARTFSIFFLFQKASSDWLSNNK